MTIPAPTAASALSPTIQRLVDMVDSTFREAVTKDLEFTGAHQSPFQNPAVIRRTLTTLLERVHAVQRIADSQAEDPEVSAERYQKTLAFRRHLLAVFDITERRFQWIDGPHSRGVSMWKDALHELCDEIEGGPDDDLLDELTIPQHNLTLRAWIEIRRVKDPRRVQAKEVAA